MTRRPAVTLMEVLIAMFIMAIGMLALMALFPVGAVSMAQALKDDRCAYASYVSENVAVVNNVRYGDSIVVTALNSSPSGLLYVDPYAAQWVPVQPALLTVGGIPGGIMRVAPSFIFTPPVAPPTGILQPSLIDRWFSLPDDIGYNKSAIPDTGNTGGIVDRGRRYSFAYLLRRQIPFTVTNPTASPVQLYTVVYSGRPVNSLTATVPAPPITFTAPATEIPLTLTVPVTPATLPAPVSSVQLNGIQLPLKRGGWVFEPTYGYFYRVTNYAENTLLGTTTVDLQQNLTGPPPISVTFPPPPPPPITTLIAMDYVAEVFDQGPGWQQ